MNRKLLKQDAYCGLKKLGIEFNGIADFFNHCTDDPTEWLLYEAAIQARILKGEHRINQMGIVDDIRRRRKEKRGVFKANNNWAPYYMRLFVVKYPEHKRRFEFRKSKEAA